MPVTPEELAKHLFAYQPPEFEEERERAFARRQNLYN